MDLKKRNLRLGVGLILTAISVACSAGELAGDSDSPSPGSGTGGGSNGAGSGSQPGSDSGLDIGDGDGATTSNNGAGGSSSQTTGNLPDEDLLPEEVEEVEDYRIPVATGRYLWSTNPTSGRVALIDAVSLSVEVLSAGLQPTYLASIPENDERPTAVVINSGSSDVTRFVVNKGKVKQDTVSIHPGANRWATSGHWAVAWSASEPDAQLDPTEGLQEITILSLGNDSMKAKRLAVGYRPRLVQISGDERHLSVVSAEGIAVVKLDDDPRSDVWIDLGFDAEVLDVSLSADGNYALVRKADTNTVEIINLNDPTDVAQLTFPGPVTDVDLSQSGRAVVVIRETRQVATFLLSEVLDDATKIDIVKLNDQVFGSAVVSDDGSVAVVYTNVVDNDVINIINLERGDDYLSYRQLSTQSPIYSIVAAHGGAHAIVLAGDGAGSKTKAFSIISLKEARFPRVVGTDATVQQVAIADDFAIVTSSAPGSSAFEAHTVLLPELSVNTVKLASQPLSVGALPDFSMGYVAQAHAEGRVTFIDFDKNNVSTLTGFELSAEVVDE